MTTKPDIIVDLKGLTVDARRWQRFVQLPEAVRTAYVSAVLSDSIDNIFEDSQLMGYYMRGIVSG